MNYGGNANFRTHWICGPCEVFNSNSRGFCLSCEKPRKKVELTDPEKEMKLRYWLRHKRNKTEEMSR